MTDEVMQGHESVPYVAARTYHHDGTWDCLRVRAYGNRALVVLVRVTSHQGRREGRLQGEAAQEDSISGGSARDVHLLNWRNAASGEPHDAETVLCGSGRGGEKRSGNGTSLAAYFMPGSRRSRSTLSKGIF
jgi:hypothetical protein